MNKPDIQDLYSLFIDGQWKQASTAARLKRSAPPMANAWQPAPKPPRKTPDGEQGYTTRPMG